MIRKILCILLLAVLPVSSAMGSDFYVGTASCSITPDKPILLSGQFYPRVGATVQYPITANALALESRDGEASLESAVIVSIDVVVLRGDFCLALQDAIQKELPNLDPTRVILFATHTHTSAVLRDGHFQPQNKGEMLPSEYVAWVIPRIVEIVRQAWETREPGKFSYGLDHAVVAYNRRAVYENGSAVMYGKTDRPDFRAVEGVEDHDIGTMFFWNREDKLKAVLVNVSCPSQEVEGASQVSSDFWGPTRNILHEKLGEDVCILGVCGAAGDMSPHLRLMQSATLRMDKLRKLTRLEEIGRRISNAVLGTYEVVQNAKVSDPVLRSKYQVVSLSQRIVTDAEYAHSKAEYERRKSDPNDGQVGWNYRTLLRYEAQKVEPNPKFATPVHVLRIGDTVLCTNQFELYSDFAFQMKARSRAVQTFVGQLSNGGGEPLPPADAPDSAHILWGSASGGTYLPSKRATEGGGYGAVIQSNTVGWQGGQELVEATLKMVDEVFK